MSEILQPWIARWGLVPDGEAFTTPYTKSWLQPVRRDGEAAMLKIATGAEEVRGGALMEWWAGAGAAKVLAREGEALLLERASRPGALVGMVEGGQDEMATRLICRAVNALHARRGSPPESLVPLSEWFGALKATAAREGGGFATAWREAERLLTNPREVTVLHGDIHHGNILDFGARGWLAIDPKGLIGERGYDFANTPRNPSEEMFLRPGRLGVQVRVIAEETGLESKRVLAWVLAHAGLSAAWSLEDGHQDRVAVNLAFIALAAAELEA